MTKQILCSKCPEPAETIIRLNKKLTPLCSKHSLEARVRRIKTLCYIRDFIPMEESNTRVCIGTGISKVNGLITIFTEL